MNGWCQVRVLLGGGADVNITTAKRETALHLAAQKVVVENISRTFT